MKSLDTKKKSIMVASLIVMLAVFFTITGCGSKEADSKAEEPKDEKAVEASVDEEKLTEEEKTKVAEIEKDMEAELAKAGSEEEKAAIKEKYDKKVKDATSGKASVKTASKAEPVKLTASSGSEKKSESKAQQTSAKKQSSTSTKKEQSSEKKSSTSTSSKHTHIKEGNMGWANSPEEIKRKYSAAQDAWWDKVVAGDMKSRQPVDYSYRKCSCGKYTGDIVYGKPHTHTVAVGNTGKWFNSKEEAEAYYDAEQRKWADKCEKGEITYEEYGRKCPSHWEWKECMCGKVTLSWWTREAEPK